MSNERSKNIPVYFGVKYCVTECCSSSKGRDEVTANQPCAIIRRSNV
jgi:hypothetical protein